MSLVRKPNEFKIGVNMAGAASAGSLTRQASWISQLKHVHNQQGSTFPARFDELRVGKLVSDIQILLRQRLARFRLRVLFPF